MQHRLRSVVSEPRVVRRATTGWSQPFTDRSSLGSGSVQRIVVDTETTEREPLSGTRYRLGRPLDGGAARERYEAEHLDHGQRVIATLLRAHACPYEWSATAHRNEVVASGRIDSPHIVDVLDSAELPDGRVLVITEQLHGITLEQAMGREPMELARVVDLGWQLCEGLQSAHGAGIVHLDLVPSNVMLVPRPGRHDRAVLLGFGTASIMRDLGHHPRGTTRFSAPETSYGVGDARADLYSLGCLLYELACGVPAFEDDDEGDALPVPPSQRAPQRGIPRCFDAIVARCLHSAPSARFQSAAELQTVLEVLRARLRADSQARPSPTNHEQADDPADDRVDDPADDPADDHPGMDRARRVVDRGQWGAFRRLGSWLGRRLTPIPSPVPSTTAG
ncbi:serine/threonine-protein kinase [Paraliomyxa miuraensis]|uniref:serine/threonine-protein kinase n=1 Tax=Paraliomyxa miuraensis TaxID=376150 RepID=UPI002252EB01|nr:serine/threonine-protein kinase [Paraliomyxa miuraensis]